MKWWRHTNNNCTRCQFPQHFTHEFFVRKFFSSVFYLHVTREKLPKKNFCTKNLREKCWWNWQQRPDLWSEPSAFGDRAHFRVSTRPAVLSVTGVRRFDAGTYTCRVDFRQSPTVYHHVTLDVIGKFLLCCDVICSCDLIWVRVLHI